MQRFYDVNCKFFALILTNSCTRVSISWSMEGMMTFNDKAGIKENTGIVPCSVRSYILKILSLVSCSNIALAIDS